MATLVSAARFFIFLTCLVSSRFGPSLHLFQPGKFLHHLLHTMARKDDGELRVVSFALAAHDVADAELGMANIDSLFEGILFSGAWSLGRREINLLTALLVELLNALS